MIRGLYFLGVVISSVLVGSLAHAEQEMETSIPGISCHWDASDNEIANPYGAISVINNSDVEDVSFYCPVTTMEFSIDGMSLGFNSSDLNAMQGINSSGISVDLMSTGAASAHVIMVDMQHLDTNYSICASDAGPGVAGTYSLHPAICSPVRSSLTVKVSLPPESILFGLRARHDSKGS